MERRSASLSSPTTAVGRQWLAYQIIRRDDEYALGNLVGDIDDPKVPPGLRLTDGDPSITISRAVLAWPPENVLHLILTHVVTVDVRLPGFRVDEKPNLHFTILRHRRRKGHARGGGPPSRPPAQAPPSAATPTSPRIADANSTAQAPAARGRPPFRPPSPAPPASKTPATPTRGHRTARNRLALSGHRTGHGTVPAPPAPTILRAPPVQLAPPTQPPSSTGDSAPVADEPPARRSAPPNCTTHSC
jgi:hypothetical protein